MADGLELSVSGAVDNAHTAFASLGGDAVMGDDLLRGHRERVSGSYHFHTLSGRITRKPEFAISSTGGVACSAGFR
jgi:hypothetical protein